MARRAAPKAPTEVPLDNAARLVLFDAVTIACGRFAENREGISDSELFERVISRLRMAVPRELHVMGERAYVDSKIDVCIESNLLTRSPSNPELLTIGPETPEIRYPDGTVRPYTPGLELARERLEADETKLRNGRFDIRQVIKTSANDRKSESFRRLVASMQEHGYLDQHPITVSNSGVVVDGLARIAAAAKAEVPMKKQHRVVIPRHRDTVLQHALLMLDANAERLLEEDVLRVHEAISARTGRDWIDIHADLAITRDWRRAEPKRYDAQLVTKLIAFKGQDEAKVEVTTDGTRVGLRSVMQQAGLPTYDYKLLAPFAPMEQARTEFTGRKAIFVKITDAIVGIETMQQDRKRRRLKVDKAWDDIREWLIDTFDAQEATAPTEA